MILLEIGKYAGVWLTNEEHTLYRKAKHLGEVCASNLTDEQLQIARSLVTKSVFQRKKSHGELCYIISTSISTE